MSGLQGFDDSWAVLYVIYKVMMTIVTILSVVHKVVMIIGTTLQVVHKVLMTIGK